MEAFKYRDSMGRVRNSFMVLWLRASKPICSSFKDRVSPRNSKRVFKAVLQERIECGLSLSDRGRSEVVKVDEASGS